MTTNEVFWRSFVEFLGGEVLVVLIALTLLGIAGELWQRWRLHRQETDTEAAIAARYREKEARASR